MIDKDDDIAEAEQRQAEDYAEAEADDIAGAEQREVGPGGSSEGPERE